MVTDLASGEEIPSVNENLRNLAYGPDKRVTHYELGGRVVERSACLVVGPRNGEIGSAASRCRGPDKVRSAVLRSVGFDIGIGFVEVGSSRLAIVAEVGQRQIGDP
ncbi:30S ribosomal protein S5 [Striga asiatica]|uniref:30S ribosomal protein S5 n=1 Tax=Striga asiatica TaxID=4170 RepID=A0A5A7PKB1_STRAF|nr:30S ribosomal protein S5 [Striga asiatica]